MDQIIGEQENVRDIIDRIERECSITVLREEQDSDIIFAIQGDGDSWDGEELCRLTATPLAAAMRRNPPVANAKRPPCMADIERVKINRISAVAVQKEHGKKELVKKLLSSVLAYQNQMQVPLCLVERSEVSTADFFDCLGFQYICDRQQYELNTKMISEDLLERAAAGEIISLESNVVLQVVGREDVLSLAHFVNSRLCRQYGFFIIRSAAYCEGVLEKLQDSGGNMFQIVENGVRKGCFAYIKNSSDCIREAVFDSETDRERYLSARDGRKPAVMARIVNLPEMLKHVAGKGKVTIAIQIKDPVLAENDGFFLWYLDDGGSRIERVEQPDAEGDSSMRPEVTVTIGAFTAFIFRYMQLKQNAKFDSIYLAGPAWLDEI